MRAQLREALDDGALGLSTGLAYLSANAASTEEVLALAEPLAAAGAIYTTHLRTETEAILDAMQRGFQIGRECRVPVVISHLKCAGVANWGRSGEVLQHAGSSRERSQPVSCDCYPYAAGSSTLDLRQVDERVKIMITWSTPHPEVAGQTLKQIAEAWAMSQVEAARRLQPAGAIYHSISEEDMRRILSHPATMIGSDGLPNDPRPHPAALGNVSARAGPIQPRGEAVSARRGGSQDDGHACAAVRPRRSRSDSRGLLRRSRALRPGDNIETRQPLPIRCCPAEGITAVWVNGVLSYTRTRADGRTRWTVSETRDGHTSGFRQLRSAAMSIKRYGVEGGKGTGGQHLPFARAVEADGWLYVSGQVPMVNGEVVDGNIVVAVAPGDSQPAGDSERSRLWTGACGALRRVARRSARFPVVQCGLPRVLWRASSCAGLRCIEHGRRLQGGDRLRRLQDAPIDPSPNDRSLTASSC